MPAPDNGMPSNGLPSRPPHGYFSVGQRLFRGYGPVAAFAALVVILALAVPSTVPKTSNSASVGTGSQSGLSGGTGSVASGSGPSSGSSALGTSGCTGAVAAPTTTVKAKHGTATKAKPSSGTATACPTSGSSSAVAVGTGSSGRSGTAGKAGSAGHSVNTPGVVATCGATQVPGDPYSPPCVSFSGGNRGATSKGLTADTVTVAFRLTNDQSFQQTLAQLAGAQLRDTNADTQRTILALAQYFNTHFQFYGRKIKIVFYNGQGSLSNELLGTGQAQAEADATTVAQQIHAFADLSAESEPYADALAKQGVMAFGDPYMSSQWHQQHAPYSWSIATDGTDVASLAAHYAVQKLCPQGRPATYAGGSLKNAHRKFALLAPENSWYQVSVDVAKGIMAQSGCQATKFVYTLDLGTESQQAANLIAKLKAGGYTTVLCGCDPIFPVYLSGQGAQQGYIPEFIITGTALTDADYTGQLYNQQFQAHAFGISPNNPEVPYNQTIGYAAYKTVRTDEPAFFVDLIYAQMDQLAIGMQMAGPTLNPQSFQQGMFNYPAKEGPLGLWGFGPQQYTIPNDVREICWNPSATSPFNGKQGAYVPGKYNNARWLANTIPSGQPGCPIPSS
jgi:hypothetical protein